MRATATEPTGLDLEVEGDEGEDEALEVLDEVVEHAQALGVGAVVDIG